MSSHPDVGPVLRNLREADGLTQEKLGELSGIHATHIGRIERGESDPSLGTLVDLALALKLEPDYLVRFKLPGGFKLAIAPPATDPEERALTRTPTRTLAVHEVGQGQESPSRRQFVVVIQRIRDGYSAFIPDLPGCTASGATEPAAESGILKAGTDHVRALRRAGRPIPAASAYAMRMTLDA
jgi:transcriptional regulator with XRE-family HTH domain